MDFSVVLFQYATEGIIIVDCRGKIIQVNPAAENLFGYTAEELAGREIELLVPDALRKKHEQYRKEYQRNPYPRRMGKNLNISGLHKEGRQIPLLISLSYFKKDEELYIICFIVDHTEHRAQEEEIKKINSELEEKVMMRTRILQEALTALENSRQELHLALEQEKELNAMKTRFVSMASHEFRTPLSTILSSASLIERYAEGNEKILGHVRKIKNSVSGLTFILNDFLSVGKLEDGSIRAVAREIHLKEFTGAVIQDMGNLLKAGQKIRIREPEGDVVCYTDPNMLRNILINLVSNAIKFSAEGKKIELRWRKEGDLSIFEVEDEGMGIPEEEQKHIFTRFFRADNATNIQGTGLGLYIVRKMVEMLHGRIAFRSKPGIGTTFIVEIPDYEKDIDY